MTYTAIPWPKPEGKDTRKATNRIHVSYNNKENNLATWKLPEQSYLHQTENGFERVEAEAGVDVFVDWFDQKKVENIVIEKYSTEYEFLSGMTVDAELPYFGGCYFGKDYNFLIFGQENLEEDNTAEVIRVVKYSKKWERLDSAGLYGINTTIPFDAGNVSCVEKGGNLYVRTSHKMYGGHQANLSFIISQESMKVKDVAYKIGNIDSKGAYVSHSFNQLLIMDDGDMVAVDHGDAYPRSMFMSRFEDIGSHYTKGTAISLLELRGGTGNNKTDAFLGGLAASQSSYLVVGNYLKENTDENRSIWLSIVPKEDISSHQLIYLTGGEEPIDTPVLVKINDNRFMVAWNTYERDWEKQYIDEANGIYFPGCELYIDEAGIKYFLPCYIQELQYVFIDGKGKKLTKIMTSSDSVNLSDCQPIVKGNKVIWYTTMRKEPIFYEINTDTYSISQTPAHYKMSVGDINADGSINSTDALMVLKIAAKLITPSEAQKTAGDVNHDGNVNSTDALMILKYAAGLIKTF